MIYSKRSNLKAVLQSHTFTGASRVFYSKRINGVSRVVCKTGMLRRPYTVTGYPTLKNVLTSLKGAVPVGHDEQVLFDGEPCETYLGHEA